MTEMTHTHFGLRLNTHSTKQFGESVVLSDAKMHICWYKETRDNNIKGKEEIISRLPKTLII